MTPPTCSDPVTLEARDLAALLRLARLDPWKHRPHEREAIERAEEALRLPSLGRIKGLAPR
jgi:hypothetical protein